MEIITQDVLIIGIVSLAVYIFIMYEVIQFATRSQKILAENKKQTRLLMELAKAAGVPENSINEIDTDPFQLANEL